MENRPEAENREKVAEQEIVSGLQKGPAERGHVKKTSKIVRNCQKVFRHFSTIFAQGKKTSKIVKKRQKVFSTLFDNFRAAPFFRPLLGGALTLPTAGNGQEWPSGKKWKMTPNPVPSQVLGRYFPVGIAQSVATATQFHCEGFWRALNGQQQFATRTLGDHLHGLDSSGARPKKCTESLLRSGDCPVGCGSSNHVRGSSLCAVCGVEALCLQL